MSLRLSVAALVAFAAMITIGSLTPGNAPPAVAQDAQTDAMIWHFNVYRMQNGAAPLYTHPGLSTLMQDSAQHSAAACGPILPPKPSYASQWSRWYETGGETADLRWSDWVNDPLITSRVADPDFNSVGVGRALSHCSQGWTWTAAVAKVSGSPGGPYPTPTGPVQQTPSPTPHTPSPSPTPSNSTPTPSPNPSSSATPTPSVSITQPVPTTPVSSVVPTPTGTSATPSETNPPTPTPTLTPVVSPFPTTVSVNGDANSDGDVGPIDGMLILFLAADLAANTPCLAAQGVNCTGLVDEFDVLALFRFLANLNPNIPFGCPPIGVTPTPAPTAAFTSTPTATATFQPTPTPTPGPTVAPGSIAHCFLALASYEVTFAPALNGAVGCSVPAGVDYSCDFPGDLNSFTCDSSSPTMPDRDCYVLDTTWAYCGVLQGQQGTAYQCNNNQGVSQCFPADDPSSPNYDCTADQDSVLCSSDRESFPHFLCTRNVQEFSCSVVVPD